MVFVGCFFLVGVATLSSSGKMWGAGFMVSVSDRRSEITTKS